MKKHQRKSLYSSALYSGRSHELLALWGQSSAHAVRDDANRDQRHGGALTEGQQVEEGGGVGGGLEAVEQVQEDQRADDTPCFNHGAVALFGFGVERRVQAQTQPKQRAHVTQQTGEGRGVQVDPLGPDAPLLGFVQGPQQVHTQSFEQEVEANGEGGEEERGVEVFLHAGAVDPLGSVEGLGHNHACRNGGRLASLSKSRSDV